MKRFYLILFFIIIIFRLLQEIYIRTNVQQNVSSGLIDLGREQMLSNLENESGNGDCDGALVLLDSDFTTYSDTTGSNVSKILTFNISSQLPIYDRLYFFLEGLINWLNNAYCSIYVSIDVWKDILSGSREAILNRIKMSFDQIYYSSISDIITGITFGMDGYNNSNSDRLFNVTGTQHLMAISGFNLTFFVAFINRLYGRFFSKSAVLVLNVITASFFIWLIGITPGILRAFLMFLVTHLAYFFKRQSQVFYSLLITLTLVILIDSSSIFTISFQLSYAATLGIILFSNFSLSIKNLADRLVIGSPGVTTSFIEYLLTGIFVSFTAEVMVFPLLVYYFKEFSLIGAFATVAVSWAMPLILQFGIVIAIAQFVLPINLLFVLSIPLFLVTKLVIFLLNLFYFDWFLLSFPDLGVNFLIVYYLGFLLIYGFILNIEKSRNRKKYEETYHFRF